MQGTHGSSMTLEVEKQEDDIKQGKEGLQTLQDITKNQPDCQPQEPVDQQTLQPSPRANLRIPGDIKDRIGISIHGPYCHGPRCLLSIAEDTQEMMLKVGCSAAVSSEQLSILFFCYLFLKRAHVSHVLILAVMIV